MVVGYWLDDRLPGFSVGGRISPDARAIVLPIESCITVAASYEFADMIQRWRTRGVTDDQLCDVAAAEFDRQLAFQDRDRKRAHILSFVGGPMGHTEGRWEHRRMDFVTKAVGEKAFHHWNQPKLLQRLRLDGLNLTADETNAVYQICQQYQYELRQAEAGDHPDQQARRTAAMKDFVDWYDLQKNTETRVEQHYRRALRTVLGERRYCLFIWGNQFDEMVGWLSNKDNSLSEDQRIALVQIDGWEREQRERAETLVVDPATGTLHDKRIEVYQSIHQAAQAKRATIYAQTNAVPVPPR